MQPNVVLYKHLKDGNKIEILLSVTMVSGLENLTLSKVAFEAGGF